ncbi:MULTISPECIES: response regulator [unclassified Rhizobium]|uniref:response regulator transcription factor n=1 Tax=unclassified Rhizobium TaxID=2613769 RepID=UPI001A97FE0D|nr:MULTISPECIES: response regulator [unclassified Rhizobium]MBX5173222.1 response regulator transcription factor [Rhizobium sp. NZLR1b]MBX5190352.1 response regulator transcription factor [Rhizobium sp. NZLR3b]MBX5201257.1 response regulator transcription factor [Rhizobium sp. NZLR1]QSZ23011.1 response regulator transcription factor [Rhizobium sp. NZLR1]
MSNSSATIHIVDDDVGILRALKRLLTIAGHNVETHLCAEDFLAKHDPDKPGCAIVDLGLPGLDGFGLQDSLVIDHVERPIIFLTGNGNIPASVRAMKAGAVDFLTKPVEPNCLLSAVSQAIERDAAARQIGQERRIAEHRFATLTRREREVFAWVVAGRLNKQIAAELGTVEKTVKVHRGRMMEKMGVRNVADLVRLGATLHH